jgi:hypothetical protein
VRQTFLLNWHRVSVQLMHPRSSDPIARGLEVATRSVSNRTPNEAITPERLWEDLKADGFYFPHDPPGSDEHGRFFAHLVLDHAYGLRLIAGNTAEHRYWAL